jgi:diguanylate cyclase (GGDEF)-like protein
MAESLLEDLRQDLYAAADTLGVEAAADGERLIARLRLAAVAGLLVFQLLPVGHPDLGSVGWAVIVLALAWALAATALVQRPAAWVAVVGSVMDPSLVSLGLLSYALLGGPLLAVHSAGLFETYFVALMAGTLRQSWRLCVLTGALALAQYGALLVWAGRQGDLDWKRQGYRLVLLAGATGLSALAVLRSARLRRLSTIDRLTGLRSRRLLEERLAGELIRAQRYNRPLTVAVCDVDDFRRFNEEYGHARGDSALQAVASVFGQSFRRTDVVARQGGEFALLLPETRAGDAWHKLEAMRLAVAATPVGSRPGRPPVTLTMSVGLAAWPGDGEDATTLLASADSRLYEAKSAGRNCVVGPPPAAPPRAVH